MSFGKNATAGSNYFVDGVSSGDPTQKTVILWSRVQDDKIDALEVEYEVSKDITFDKILKNGKINTNNNKDHTLKIDIDNLRQDTTYYYRFKYNNQYSETGKTKTLPEDPKKLRIAFVSCQNFGGGYFTSYKYIIEDNPDLIIMLGDSIYEHAKYQYRKDESGYGKDLESYRKKYKYYFTDNFYKEAKEKIPFMYIWDDHEIENDYSGVDFSKIKEKQMKDGYQAFFEYNPVRKIGENKIYRNYNIGNLLDLYFLDGRQYRKEPACDGLQILNYPCTIKSYKEDNTYLGKEQKQWLKDNLKNSKAKWKIISNNTMMMETNFFGALLNFDEWDGYMKEKQEMLEYIYDNNIKNTLVFTGDLHMFIQGKLMFKNKKVIEEFVATSISSPIPSFVNYLTPIAPLVVKDITLLETAYRGYILADFNSRKTNVYFYSVPVLSNKDFERKLLKKFEIKPF
ncbi:MAG: alkaline phosphatase D family protein [Cyanobacteriota bacterium]